MYPATPAPYFFKNYRVAAKPTPVLPRKKPKYWWQKQVKALIVDVMANSTIKIIAKMILHDG